MLMFCCLFADPSDSVVHERLDRITRMTEIDDLQESHDHPVAPLCIKVNIVINMSCQQFLCSYVFHITFFFLLIVQTLNVVFKNRILETTLTQQANALRILDDSRGTEQTKSTLTTEEAYGSLKESISDIKRIGLSNSTVKPEIALTAIRPLFHVFCNITCSTHSCTHTHILYWCGPWTSKQDVFFIFLYFFNKEK